MSKKLKRILAVVVTLVFVVSIVPNVVFADTLQTTSATIPWTNYAYSRDGGTDGNGDPPNYAYKYSKFTLGGKEYHVIIDGGSFDGYLQLDLTGYEEILKNPSTTVTYSVAAGGEFGSAKLYDFSFVLAPDKVDGYSNQTITHNIAKSLGFLNTTDRPVLFENTQCGNVLGQGKNEREIVSGTANKEALVSVLEEGPQNSLVSLVFRRISTVDNSSIVPNVDNTGLTIDYVESEIDNQAYVDGLVNTLKWEDMFSASAQSIADDLVLPSKWHGADVTWSSSNTSVIGNDGKITAGYDSVSASLTATLSYKGLSDEYKTATKTFDVTVAPLKPTTVKIALSQPVYTRGGAHSGTYQGLSTYNSMIIGSTPYRAYAKLNLAGYQEILRNPHTTVAFSAANGGFRSSSYIRDFKVVIAKDSADSYDNTTLTYDDATRLGLHDADRPALFIDNDGIALGANGQYNIVSGPADKNVLLAALNEGVDNDIVTICFVPLVNGDAFIETSSNYTYLSISYYESEIDDEQHGIDMAAEFAWDKFSSEEINAVTNATKLPLKYKGLDVVWTSGDEVAANPQTGVITQSDNYKSVHLTASLSYKGVSYGTKSFDVRISKILEALNGINDGSQVLTISAGAVSKVENKGVGGKAANDSYINYANTFNDNEKYYPVSMTNANGANDIFEISAMIPEGSDGLHFYMGIFGTTGQQDGTRMTLPFTIKADGIYYGYQSQSHYKIIGNDGTKWTNYAFVAPKGMTGAVDEEGNSLDDKTYEIYVNGVKVFENNAQITNGGFAYIRFMSMVDSEDDTIAYLDNIRVYSGEYNPAYDKLPLFESTTGVVDNKIVLKDSSATVADVLAGITVSEDASVRVYDALNALVKDYTVAAVGKKIVVADRNGTTLERAYSTYEIIDVAGREIVFGTPKLTWVNGSDFADVSVLNYSDAPVSYQVYVALYEDGQLVNYVSETLTAQPGKSATVTPSISAVVNQKAKLFVWNADGITPELTAVKYN